MKGEVRKWRKSFNKWAYDNRVKRGIKTTEFEGEATDDVLVDFFTNEVHPAPQAVVQAKDKSGLSWNELRSIYKN